MAISSILLHYSTKTVFLIVLNELNMASEQLRVEKRVGQPKISAFNSITIYRYEFFDFQLYRYTEIYDI